MNPEPHQSLKCSASDLRALRVWLSEWALLCQGPAVEELQLAIQILDRDLLPRLENDLFVVGLVGPNNAGKSALFNSIVGNTSSPSRAYGGATRRLLAAHSFNNGEAPSVRGFEKVVRVEPTSEGVQAVEQTAPQGELLAVPCDTLPNGLLIVDAPDFDSIKEQHKESATSLMRITDLAAVVVTRHS